MKHSILLKLIVAFVVPTASLFSVFAFLNYSVQRDDLEAELGRRLQSVASAAATQLRGKYLLDLQAGDELESLYYSGGMKRLQQMSDATGVERLYVFDAGFATRLDTLGTPIGSMQFQAEIDRQELRSLFDTGKTVTSTLFEGIDGRPYKAGYAPIFATEEDVQPVLAIGADAPAEFFVSLANLRKQMILYGLLLLLAVTVASILVGLRIVGPLRTLASAAEKIGSGDLSSSIAVTSKDEIAVLATTMEQMRSDLRARDERMQMMVAGIAHEVRNPLGGMELFCGILKEELAGDTEKVGHVHRISKELGHLSTVVENFLDYARRPAPQIESVSLDILIREVAELQAAELENAGLGLCLELDEVVCQGDAVQLRGALLNLLRNAISAGRASPRDILIALHAESNQAILEIRNYGSVIAEEHMAQLFEPFFTTKQKGTGLGLAFVKEIVNDLGGSIEVSSDTELGTRFMLRIPLHRHEL